MLSALRPSQSLVAGELRPDASPAGLCREGHCARWQKHKGNNAVLADRRLHPQTHIAAYAHEVFDLMSPSGTSTSRCSTTFAEPELLLVGFCNEHNAGYACIVIFTVGRLSVFNAITPSTARTCLSSAITGRPPPQRPQYHRGVYRENLPVICFTGGSNYNDYETNRILNQTTTPSAYRTFPRSFAASRPFQPGSSRSTWRV